MTFDKVFTPKLLSCAREEELSSPFWDIVCSLYQEIVLGDRSDLLPSDLTGLWILWQHTFLKKKKKSNQKACSSLAAWEESLSYAVFVF